MNLPHLEYINMSENQIKDIKPLAELNCKKLKEICLQNNIIEDFSVFLNSEFPELETLRIENNIFNKDSDEFKKLLRKYGKKVIYIAINFEEFNKKYKCNIEQNLNSINLSGLRAGDYLLQKLYLIIKPENTIKELNLHNNGLKDVSLISRIPLIKLELLDLSSNEITNLKFLIFMKCIKLKYIYLNDNHLKDITPIIKMFDTDINNNGKKDGEEERDIDKRCNFPNLFFINLKNNLLTTEDVQNKNILQIFKNNNIAVDI